MALAPTTAVPLEGFANTFNSSRLHSRKIAALNGLFVSRGSFLHKINTNVTRGKKGEEAAARYLQNKGYAILVRNYRKSFGEIDLIAQEGGTLVFVEVKTRHSRRYGVPQEAVDERKQRQLARIAQDYLAAHHLENAPARFDVIAVTLDREDQPARIDHIDNAFELSE